MRQGPLLRVIMCGREGLDNFFIFQQFRMLQYNEKVISQARKTRGYLEKCSSGLISIWQKRYFILLDNNLCYYGDETLQEAKKTINIAEINYIKVVDSLQFHLVTKKRIYQLRADDESTRDLWVASLNILINYKEWAQAASSKQNRSTDKKIVTTGPQSRVKKIQAHGQSPLSHSKISSTASSRVKLDEEFTPQRFFQRICMPKLGERWGQEGIRSKIILLKQSRACYFVISCKTLLFSHQDDDFLEEELIHPYEFNSLYYYQFGKVQNPEVVQICKCSDIQGVQESSKKIIIILANKTIDVQLDYKKMEIVDVLSLVKKLKHSIVVAKQYYNPSNIKIKRNIDRMLHKFQQKENNVAEIAKRQIEKCCVESKEVNAKQQYRKNLQNMKKALKQIINCCDAVGKSRLQFKQKFVKEFNDIALNYIQKTWGSLQKQFTLPEQKKVFMIIFELWKVVKEIVKDSKMFEVSITMHKQVMQKYKEQILLKIDSCFSLKQNQIIDEVKIQMKGQNQIIDKMETIFYSNNIYRQFHVDIRLVLYEFPEMPIHQKVHQQYLFFFGNIFRYISEQTFKFIDKWKNVQLILGTCNQIEFIKNSLFEEMHSKLTKDYPSLKTSIKDNFLKDLQNQISNTQILLVKKLFVSTFSTIDRSLLSKNFDELSVNSICEQIIQKLKGFNKINKYVKRNIFEASFEQICYFYYSNIIKFNRKMSDKQYNTEFYIKKLNQQIKAIGLHFQNFLYQQKIYTHLKDLTLLKQFIQTDLSQMKKICQNLKKQFGNSFTEIAVINLLSLRDMSQQIKQNLALQFNQIVKNSADTPEQISLMSSNRESFFQNWNNTRSRKSTLTLSLNEFYENQYAIHQSKYNCSVWKQGYLIKRKIMKNISSGQLRAFFKIKQSQLEEYESNTHEEPSMAYELRYVKKCYIHPEKNYMFILEMNDFKLQFKAETFDEAKEWVRNIQQEASVLSMLRDMPPEKERTSENNVTEGQKELKDPSTMQSYSNKNLKDRSLQKSVSLSPKMSKKGKQQKAKQQSLEKPTKSLRQIKEQPGDDNCLKCSRGFLF